MLQYGHYLTAVAEALLRLNTPFGKTYTLPSNMPIRVLEEIAA